MQPLKTDPPGTITCDVLVAGAGAAGVIAAVSAARDGCRVLLIEKGIEIGGTGVRGMLRTICGLYLNGSEAPEETLNEGLVREVVSGLGARAPQRTATKIGKVYVLPCSPVDLQEALVSLLSAEKNVSVLLKAKAASVSVQSGRVTGAVVDHEGKVRNIRAGVFIDCTGNGDVAVMAGAEFDLASPEEIQMAGFTARISGIADVNGSLAVKVPFVLARAVKDRKLAAWTKYTTWSPADEPGEGHLKFSVAAPDDAGREQRTRDEAAKAVRILAESMPEFRNAAIVETPSGILDREGRRIRGEYILTEEDVLSGRKFSDGVVKNAWPIELWDRNKGTVYRYVPAGDHYEIPFRCLQVKGFSNLLVAGRCISVTREALGSTRVMGSCMAMGDVAGRAAAGLVRNGSYPVYTAQRTG